MADSPAKRRKTSPTTSFPIDASGTPSRIPVLRQDGAKNLLGRPSFASPTRASLARHNPQLLNRPSSSGSGSGAERPRSGGKNPQDDFVNALDEARSTIEGRSGVVGEDIEGTQSESTTQENEPPQEIQRATTPRSRSTRPVGGGLSAKPKRMSRSPMKSARKPVEQTGVESAPVLDDNINPFQKKGLRRSPISSQVDPIQKDSRLDSIQQENTNPFKKTGLRRSPIPSRPVAVVGPSSPQTEGPPDFSTTPPGPPPSRAIQPTPTTIEKAREEIALAIEAIEQPRIPQSLPSQPVEHIVVEPEQPRIEVLEVEVRPQQRVSQAKEVIHSGGSGRPEEPELPLTPTQRGLADPIVTTPPTGIHDTPSRKARRSKALASKIKSSPLKPRGPSPKESTNPKEPIKPAESAPRTVEIAKPEKIPKRRKSARFLVPEDPHASKKKAREDLLKELQQLEADVALGNQENERLRLRQESRKTAATAPKDLRELVSMLIRSTAPEPESVSKQKPTSVFKSIDSFLPFRSRRRALPIALPVSDKPLSSHLPIDLQDPLPYLQAFSPLTYTSTITLLPSQSISSESPSQESDQPAIQRHLINASHPSGLFASRILMLVDTSNFSISSLEILKLDTSAENELGDFARERASGEGTLGKDLSVVCWAMGRWVEVAISRARFWCAVETEFGTAEARVKALQINSCKTKKRKRQGTVDDGSDEVNEQGEGDHDHDGEIATGKWTRRELLPHMGRTNLEINTDEVELRFEWKIGFDWTGEAHSSISANARLPRNWQEGDDRNSLSKVPDTFQKLVKEKGPLGAVRAIIGLLMSAD